LLINYISNAQESTLITNDSLLKQINGLKKDLENIKRLKINDWIQSQYQLANNNGIANLDGGNFEPNSNSHFMIRRGRIKFT
jgi:hypothetical protein